MNLPQYPLTASTDHLNFEFYSDGPNGKIKKVIRYTRFEELEVYNLGFGDKYETTGKIDDLTVSNNLDRDKILGTVVNSILYFFRMHPSARIIFVGRTPVRMRLYMIQIAKHWNLVNQVVSLEGFIDQRWEPYRQNRSYEVILIAKRKL